MLATAWQERTPKEPCKQLDAVRLCERWSVFCAKGKQPTWGGSQPGNWRGSVHTAVSWSWSAPQSKNL